MRIGTTIEYNNKNYIIQLINMPSSPLSLFKLINYNFNCFNWFKIISVIYSCILAQWLLDYLKIFEFTLFSC